MILSFISTVNYLVDAYTRYAASTLAANAVFRATFGAIFPLFSKYMYANLGTLGASMLVAGLATAIAPVPFLFVKFGPRIRARSKFAPEHHAPATDKATIDDVAQMDEAHKEDIETTQMDSEKFPI
jgi:hypothetical protein